MRNPLIALVPAVLIAGWAHAQTQAPVAEDQPAEAQAEQAEREAEPEEEKAPPPEVTTTNVEGVWERSSAGGRDTATFTSATGEMLFSASCIPADTETGNKMMVIKAASAEDTVGAIDLFTSAGNARVPAAPDLSPDTAAGMAEPVSQQTFVLASGAGDLRVVSGSRGMVFETDPMLKSVVRACHPAPGAVPQVQPEEEADEEAEPAATNS
ncbi:hypothetical protein K1X12_12680 [Hyphomonas sp. WL0036]|uniref:hypothetical protein n=1 Tax=Hyphomonas sediminis TaxID=2866160 RepID=UPI001C8083CF|nr:hypothetical protein [Hyphomonas sediminis]MBY9067760.1 hypothetical protein [Hyphomonas sediminis]